MSKHTPKPWLYIGSSITAAHPERAEGSYEGFTVAQRINRKEDGWLIESAPDLLDALKVLVEHMEESHQDELDANHHGDTGPCSYCKSIAAARAAIAKALGQ